MPTYVYECTKCGKRFEITQSISDPPRKRCPKCRGKVFRVISGGGGIILKGPGFYATDYRSAEYRAKEKADKEKESSRTENESKEKSKKSASK